MAGTKQALTIDAYGGFAFDVAAVAADLVTPIPLTGYSAVASIRADYQDAASLVDFTVTVDEPTGIIHLVLLHTDTLKLQGTLAAVWDLFVTAPGGQPVRWLYGGVKINQAASRT